MSSGLRGVLVGACLSLVCCPAALADPPSEKTPLARTDLVGDPLPDEALARLGTTRFRLDGLATGFAISPDGKRMAVVGGHRGASIQLLDTDSGKEVRQIAVSGIRHPYGTLAFSPDGKRLAFAQRHEGGLQIFDPATGTEAGRMELPERGLGGVRFSADGKVLVGITEFSRGDAIVMVWDTVGGKELGRFAVDENTTTELVVSPDGKHLASCGFKSKDIALLEARTGKVVRRFADDEAGRCTGAIFSPDGKHLAVSEFAAVSVWEIATGKMVYRSAARRDFGVLTYSPDGKTLARTDRGAVQLWDAASGRRLGLYGGLIGEPLALVFSEDKLLALGLSGRAFWVWDVKARQSLSPGTGHREAIQSIVFTADGAKVLTSAADGVLTWDVRTGKEFGRVEVKESEDARLRGGRGSARKGLICPDGKRLLVNDDRDHLAVADAATGEIEFDLGRPEFDHGRGLDVDIAADGDVAVIASRGGRQVVAARLWSLTSGRRLHLLETKFAELRSVALSRDGKAVAVSSESRPEDRGQACIIQVWDTASGKSVVEIQPGEHAPSEMAFSPDGAILAAVAHSREGRTEIILWNVAARRVSQRFRCDPGLASKLLFSPDGRAVALVTQSGDRQRCRLRVWEVASGSVRREFPAGDDANVLAFSPDSRTLACSEGGTVVTLWDVGGRLPASKLMKPNASKMEDWWAALDEADGTKAYRAMVRLAAAPKETVEFLKGRLRPAEKAPHDEKAIARLVADLDSGEYKVREKASQELVKVGTAAKAALERALRDKPTLEHRRRIEEQLELLSEIGPPKNLLRPLRSLEVLEWVGTPEARQLLESLVDGRPDARETCEARGALARLAKRAAKP